MDFDIIGNIDWIIENDERWYMSTYIYCIIKVQKMHMKLILSACQNVSFRDAMAEWGNLGVSLETRQLLWVKIDKEIIAMISNRIDYCFSIKLYNEHLCVTTIRNLKMFWKKIKSLYFQGGSSLIPGRDDADNYRKLVAAMDILNFERNEQETITKILACVLHIGNIYFKSVHVGFSVVCW